MRILLVRPAPSPETIGLQHVMICEPLELEYLAAAVSGMDHQVDIVDMILEKQPFARLLDQYAPDLVGITGYITHVRIIREMASMVKSWSGQCVTVVGGVHAEVVPEDFEHDCIDFIVCANGIATFKAIVDALENNVKIKKHAGIWQKGKPLPIKDTVFDHPWPDRSKVARYRERYYYLFHNPCALLKTSFGCPFQCNFCFCREITDHQYFERPVAEVIEELTTIPEREIYIVDDNFLVSRTRVLTFCEALEKHGIDKRFLIYGRADFIAANQDVMGRFAENGLRAVIVGLESCRNDDLEKLNKKTSIEINEKAVAILAQFGIDCYATMILGVDWEKRDFKALGGWLKKMDLTFVNLQPFTPLKGTSAGNLYETELRIPRDAYEKWDLAHLVLRPSRLPVATYYWNIIKLYYSVTFRPKAVFRLFKRFGLMENLRLSAGSAHVTAQYLKKVIRNLGKGS
jgi:radical SAM superfamily enzyme YgiQ (UPF0313 family)